MPESWVGKLLRAYFRYNGSVDGTDTVILHPHIYPSGVGEYWDDHTEYIVLGVNMPSTAWVTAETFVTFTRTLVSGDTYILRLKRDSTSGVDTYTGNFNLHSIILKAV